MRKIFITPKVKRFMEQADEKTRIKMNFMIAYLTDNKNVLREPYVRHISIPKYKELYELRIRTAKAMARTIFTVSEENIVLLYAFQKKCKRDNVKALECAYKMNKSSEELMEVCL